MPLQECTTLTHALPSKNNLIIIISGKLDVNSVANLWDKALQLQKQYNPTILTIDTKNLSFCDGFGATLILELQKRQLKAKKQFLLDGANLELKKLLDFLSEKNAPHKKLPSIHLNFISKTGRTVVNLLNDFRENITFLGLFAFHILKSILHPHKSIRWSEFWRAMADIGPKGLPIAALIGFLIGLISTFQSILPLGRFGAQIYIIDLVGLGMVREVGPLITSVLLAGRTASAFAAEIAAMKINQEVDALATLGINPIIFLTFPRILAATIMTPLLSMFLISVGMFGCYLIMLSLGYNFHLFTTELLSAVTLSDFISGITKTFVFGAIIAGVGCLNGIKAQSGSTAVGNATTKAVVNSLIMLVFADGIFALVYYVLKI